MNETLKPWRGTIDKNYHLKQFQNPYRSTISFCNYLEELNIISSTSQQKILDIAPGAGANLNYMSSRYSQCTFHGIDINEEMVQIGKKAAGGKYTLDHGNLYDYHQTNNFKPHGITFFQTLFILPSSTEALESICKIDSDWIGITSLFFDGDISTTTEVLYNIYADGQKIQKKSHYNVDSIDTTRSLLKQYGYTNFYYTPFTIDIDLPKPEKCTMQTYTVKNEQGNRLQFSGPLFMPWYFICATKNSFKKEVII